MDEDAHLDKVLIYLIVVSRQIANIAYVSSSFPPSTSEPVEAANL